MGKQKPTPICSFLFHLYDNLGLPLKDKEVDYKTAKEMAGYRITLELDSRAESKDEQDNAPAASLERTPGPIAQPPAQEEQFQRLNKRMKTTYWAPQGSPPVRSQGKESQPQSQSELHLEPAQPDVEEEPEERLWVYRPFVGVGSSLW